MREGNGSCLGSLGIRCGVHYGKNGVCGVGEARGGTRKMSEYCGEEADIVPLDEGSV